MKCEKVRQWLRRDLDGVAEPSVEVAAHLERCGPCRAEAERLKALAGMSRDALPAADVPPDFTHHVMASLVEPAADETLAAAARPRVRRWLPVLAALLLLLILPLFLRAGPAATGALRVERDGAWIEADRAARDDLFGLDAFAQAAVGEANVTALEPSLLRASEPLELLGGQVHVEARDPVVVQTPLAEIRLREGSACVATLGKEKEMSFDNLKRLGPTLLTVTLLAGGATVTNAEGEKETEKGRPVEVKPGRPPEAGDPEVTKALAEANRLLDEARAAMELARAQQQAQFREKDIEKQLEEVRKILERARREMGRLRWPADPLRPRERALEATPRNERGHPAERKTREPTPDRASDAPFFAGKAGKGPAASSVDELLRRAREGDRDAQGELRRLVREIETVVGPERPPDGPERVTALAEQEVARLKAAIDEASRRLRRDDIDLDAEIQRRAQLQARLMRIVELLDASRDQAELVELYRKRGRTREADEAARRLQHARAELAELLRQR